MTVDLENEKKKNIRLAIAIAALGVLGLLGIYIIFFAIMFFAPFVVFSLFPFPTFSEEVVGLDDNLVIISKSFDFKGATYEQPPREKMTLRIYTGESVSEPEDIRSYYSLYATENKIYFFDKGLYRTFDLKKWEEVRSSGIGDNPKGAVGNDGIWVLSLVRGKPALKFLTEMEIREMPLPEDVLGEKGKVRSSQLIYLKNELHLFTENDNTLVWNRYDGEKWRQPMLFESSGKYKAIVFQDEIFLMQSRTSGEGADIALRVYTRGSWSEPKIYTISGITMNTILAIFNDEPIIFQQGFFSQKYYVLNGEKLEGPFGIGKPFYFSANIWKTIFISLSSYVMFGIILFLLSLLISKYKLRTWRIDSREYEFASLFRRFFAKTIDLLIIAIPVGFPLFLTVKDDFISENPFKFFGLIFFSIAGMVLSNFLYHSLLEGLWGKTIGKKISGIIVLKDDFSKCTLGRGFLRNLMRIVDSFFYYLVAGVTMAGTMKWQRLGDLVAGTVVIRDKTQ